MIANRWPRGTITEATSAFRRWLPQFQLILGGQDIHCLGGAATRGIVGLINHHFIACLVVVLPQDEMFSHKSFKDSKAIDGAVTDLLPLVPSVPRRQVVMGHPRLPYIDTNPKS